MKTKLIALIVATIVIVTTIVVLNNKEVIVKVPENVPEDNQLEKKNGQYSFCPENEEEIYGTINSSIIIPRLSGVLSNTENINIKSMDLVKLDKNKNSFFVDGLIFTDMQMVIIENYFGSSVESKEILITNLGGCVGLREYIDAQKDEKHKASFNNLTEEEKDSYFVEYNSDDLVKMFEGNEYIMISYTVTLHTGNETKLKHVFAEYDSDNDMVIESENSSRKISELVTYLNETHN